MEKHLTSVFHSNKECIIGLTKLFTNNKIDLDPCYNQGKFYKGTNIKPTHRYDLVDHGDNVVGNAETLVLPEKVSSILIDPPFLWNKYDKGTDKIMNRFSKYQSREELLASYKGMIRSASNNLNKKGILIFKCQDCCFSGRNYFQHNEVMNIMEDNDIRVIDIAICLNKSRLTNHNKTQKHLRKSHTFFIVGRKKN